jgi:outer membrane protein assembly factor BamB
VYTTPSVASDSSVFITSGSNLYGFSKSGAPLWSIIPLGGNSFVTPTIDSIQQRLYVGVSNKNFFAVNYKTGKIEWNIMSDAPINTSAVITGDRKLVFTSESGTLYGFDIFTNAIQTVPKWKISFGDIVTKAPAIDATNNIYIGTNTGRLIKLKLNEAGTVSVLWNVTLPSPIQSSPVIDADGFVYVGQNSGDFSKINPTNGELIWTFNTSSTINSAPFINEYGTIYIANESGYVYAIDANKNIKWMYKDEDGIVANILYVKGMLYFGSLSGAYTAIFDDPNSVAINTNLTTTVSAGKVNQSIKTLNTTAIPVREPIWGTFQGNYKRNGAKPLDCPPKPTIRSLNNGLFSFCESSSLPIRYSDTTINFVWKYQDTLLTESKSRTLNVTKPGKYAVAVTNVYGCTTSSDLVTVSKLPIPATPNIIRAQNGNLLSNYNSGNKWYKDNNLLTDTTSFLVPKGVGNYSLQTSQNGCISQMSTSYYYVVTNVVQLENGQYINLNPNPFINRLIINFNINKNPSLNADVIDFATGRLITSRKNVFTNTDLNLANINAGIYLIKVYSNDLKVNVTFKIVKL